MDVWIVARPDTGPDIGYIYCAPSEGPLDFSVSMYTFRTVSMDQVNEVVRMAQRRKLSGP